MLALLVFPAVAHAATPVPKPKPTTDRADPQAAISRFVDAQKTTVAGVAAYAPSSTPDLRPTIRGEVAVYLVGKLAPNSGPIGDGLVWRVFREIPDANGELPLVHKARGGDLELRLPAGRYIVHVAYGRASQSRTIDLREPINTETFVLNAGGLQLSAVLANDAKADEDEASFEVYAIEGETRRLIGKLPAGVIARLPAGSYHVLSRYGGVNAVRSADVQVEAGKLTRVSMRHQAGSVRLKLVRDRNGEAIANTSWTIYGPDGNPVFERTGAYANVTLAAGNYDVVARHRNGEYSESFTVHSGDEAEVTVIARRL
ncbi:hypothetical protein [Acuticoccus mangrovi]|uniref:Uncharacterized protein n=1 Tax=Acuticoccus mangrovi TaxID=2796142 RepID=A0A934MC50_9HYPH|nr:hypothetical protein [Acuticoccus mangrovi]MBJ3774882.1 hypothetical protein [Acuticoccus mangrovi]